jgi:hypothetical protein
MLLKRFNVRQFVVAREKHVAGLREVIEGLTQLAEN